MEAQQTVNVGDNVGLIKLTTSQATSSGQCLFGLQNLKNEEPEI
jgi:hypothetical protein